MSSDALWAKAASAPVGVSRVVYDESAIQHRVLQLGQEISHDYHGKDLLVVGILKGAVVFTSDLIRHLSIPISLDFIAISNYTPALKTGEVRILKDLEEDVGRRHLLLIEDIVDTGLSLNYLARMMLNRDPASLAVCTLLDRPDLRLVEVPLRYVGFRVTQEFLVGYGLDYRNHYRQLPYIGTMRFDQEVSTQ
ncbi:MAG: hypoxanthine phosphoribosyltransferase [Acidobacteriota bacterium]